MQGIVEVFYPRYEYAPGSWTRERWDAVSEWEFNKNHNLKMALSDDNCVHEGWPRSFKPGTEGQWIDARTNKKCGEPVPYHDDPQVSYARRDIEEESRGHTYQWADLDVLEALPPPSLDSEDDGGDGGENKYPFGVTFAAMIAAMRVLAEAHGRDRVRVLFWRS